MKIEIVDDTQVRAKRDHTRVFVPMNADVLTFYNDLGKWFLHFSEPESLSKSILPKRNRNLCDRTAAVIYRRGVRVREFEASDTESLFDYNLNDLTIDEARKASDWDVKHHAGKALANADREILAMLFDRLVNTDRPVWEFSFDSYALQPSYRDTADELRHAKTGKRHLHRSLETTAFLLAMVPPSNWNRRVTRRSRPQRDWWMRPTVTASELRSAFFRPMNCRDEKSLPPRPMLKPQSISFGNCSKRSA